MRLTRGLSGSRRDDGEDDVLDDAPVPQNAKRDAYRTLSHRHSQPEEGSITAPCESAESQDCRARQRAATACWKLVERMGPGLSHWYNMSLIVNPRCRSLPGAVGATRCLPSSLIADAPGHSGIRFEVGEERLCQPADVNFPKWDSAICTCEKMYMYVYTAQQ